MSDGPPKIHKSIIGNRDSSNVFIKNKWWGQDDEHIYQSVFAVVGKIETAQAYLDTHNRRYASLYQNVDLIGFGFSSRQLPSIQQNRVTLNVVKSCVDTATAKIAKNKPRPLFLTDDGDFGLQKKAKNLTKYIDGLFESAKVYQIAQKVFVDACVFGTGAMKVYVDDENAIQVERVLINEIVVDDSEALYGEPRQLHQRRLISRDVLLDMFPEHEDIIKVASNRPTQGATPQNDSDNVMVIESWHLPSGKGAEDGKRTICIDSGTLQAEPYKKNYFPFVFMRWSNKLTGFWGMGLAEELVGIQFEITKMMRNIQLAQHLMAVPRVFVENGSMVNTAHINNEIGGIVKYTGAIPQFGTAPAMPPEIYQHLENLYKKAYEITGISMLSASAKKPGGLDSGVALREFQDIETERFIITGQRYETLFMDLARICIDMSRDIYGKSKKLSVTVKGKNFIEQIAWREVDMADDKFMMQVFPTSALPSTPAGKLQSIQELVSAGFVQKEYAMSLLGYPDLEEFVSLQTAALDDIRMLIDQMLNHGEYEPPEPFMNLDLALQITHSSYLKAKTKKGVSETNLQLLRTFMDDILVLKQASQTPAAPPAQDPNAASAGPVAPGASPPPAELAPMQGAPVPTN